jgi:hypothetical protein
MFSHGIIICIKVKKQTIYGKLINNDFDVKILIINALNSIFLTLFLINSKNDTKTAVPIEDYLRNEMEPRILFCNCEEYRNDFLDFFSRKPFGLIYFLNFAEIFVKAWEVKIN